MERTMLIIAAAVLWAACAGTNMAYQKVESALDLREHEGKKVELAGRVSRTPWQHLIGNPDGFPHSCYFDVGDFQIVVYSKKPIGCAGELAVRGTVVKVQGSSKRPRETKADETYVEYHLAADEWSCQNSAEP